jgi:hypothetical protein
MRVPGDTIFAIASLVLVAFVFIGRRTAVSEAKASALGKSDPLGLG